MKLLNKLFIISCLLFSTAYSNQEDSMELNFVNTPISHLTQLISEITGNNFISDGDIPGNFTFVSQKPILKKNLMSVYEMILRTKGFMIVNHEDKGFFMITRSNNPQRSNIEFNIKGNNYEIKTEVIYLKYFKPSKIKNIISPYFTKSGKVVADDQLGLILLTDYFDSIEKIKKIINKLDKPNNLNLHWVKLENVNIKNVFTQIKILTKLISEQYRKVITVIEDKSSNTVIISCEGDEYKKVVKLIKRIDSEAKLNLKSSVIYLKNSKATELVKIIQDMEKTRYEKGDIKDREKLSISHDISLNSIILMGEQSVINNYKSIIDKLDKPKKQVYVEAKIIEISESKARAVGIEFDNLLAGGAGNGGAWAVSGNINKLGFPTLGLLAQTGASLSDVKNGLSIGAAINLLQQNGASKTISSPKLLCLDNQESSIYVGRVSPVVSSVSQQTSTTTVPVTSYTYKDIGLTLKVKPQIMSDGKVRLDITNKLEDIIQSASISSDLPTTTKREVKTTSIVNDGDDIVIAGLIREKRIINKSKVPLLGDIPFIGGLFRNTDTTTERVNLLIILTPTVINDVSDLPKRSLVIENKIVPILKKKDLNITNEKNIVENIELKNETNKYDKIHEEHLKLFGIE